MRGARMRAVLAAARARGAAGCTAPGRPSARAAAVRALGRLDDERAGRALMEALRDDVFWVRYYAARALADQRHSDAVAALNSAALNDPAPPVRIAATEALGVIDPDSASNALIHLAGDPSMNSRPPP